MFFNSNKIRTEGFKIIFKKFPKPFIDKLVDYHEMNGGLSRYHKVRYFFEKYGFRVCSRLADFLGIKSKDVRLFFIYSSFLVLV